MRTLSILFLVNQVRIAYSVVVQGFKQDVRYVSDEFHQSFYDLAACRPNCISFLLYMFDVGKSLDVPYATTYSASGFIIIALNNAEILASYYNVYSATDSVAV